MKVVHDVSEQYLVMVAGDRIMKEIAAHNLYERSECVLGQPLASHRDNRRQVE